MAAEPADAPAVREVDRDAARQLIEDGAQLVDVRVEHEWETGHIAGATHIPLDELPQRSAEIDKQRPVIFYCRGGNRSSMATAALTDAGYDAAKLSEGITGWEQEGLPLEPEGGYVTESGKAAAVIEDRKRAANS